MIKLAARARNPEEALKCLDLGFTRLEITLPCPGGSKEEEAWSSLSATRGVSYMGHGPEEGDPTDLEGLENRYLPKLKEALSVGARLGCSGLTVHFWMDSRWLKPEIAEAKIPLLSRAVEWGQSLGVGVNIENLSESFAEFSPVFDRIPNLGLTLDVGHAQLLRPENVSVEFVDRLFDRLRHLHLHDNHGGNSVKDDLHLIPGHGRVPFDSIFSRLKARGYFGWATLELKPEEMAEGRDWVTAAWDRT